MTRNASSIDKGLRRLACAAPNVCRFPGAGKWLWTLFISALVLAAPNRSIAQPAPDKPNMKALFAVVGRMHNIDQNLLEAIAAVESDDDPNAVSPKGAVGLMQLMPATADQFSVLDSFDPVSNLLGAANFIDYLRSRFSVTLGRSDLPELLAAYNAGPGSVEKFGGVPPYPETQQYVRKVISRYTAQFSAFPVVAVSGSPRSSAVLIDQRLPILPSDQNGNVSAIEQLSRIRQLRARFLRTGLARFPLNSTPGGSRAGN